MSDINSNDIATRCAICLDNTRLSRNFIDLGLERILSDSLAVEIGDPTGYSELICVQCMADVIKLLEDQQVFIIKHMINCRLATLLWVLMTLSIRVPDEPKNPKGL